ATSRLIEDDERRFEAALQRATETALGSVEEGLIARIAEGYRRYREQFDELSRDVNPEHPRHDFQALAVDNPVDRIVRPCRELLDEHDRRALETAQESERISGYLRVTMLLLGLV